VTAQTREHVITEAADARPAFSEGTTQTREHVITEAADARPAFSERKTELLVSYRIPSIQKTNSAINELP